MFIGLLAGIATGALWGLTFVAPLAIEPLLAWDLTIARYVLFGLCSALLMIMPRFRPGRIGRQTLVTGLLLGGFGYTGYVVGIFFAVRLAGVAIPPLVVGVAPIVLALTSNRAADAIPWRALAMPLGLITAGLVLVDVSTLVGAAPTGRDGIGIGLLCALASLAVWVVYATLNARIMRTADAPDALRWTCIQGIGAALGSLLLLPFATVRTVADAAALIASPGGEGFLVWAVIMGIGGSWVATLCWVVASRRLPLGLASQLIVAETVFGLLYGFVYEARWPSLAESLGATLQVGGVLAAIAAFGRRVPNAGTPSGSPAV